MPDKNQTMIDMLMQTWPARMAQDAYQAAKLPGDVYQGNVSMWGADGHTNPEVINRAADLGGLVMGGSFGQVPKGAIGSSFSEPLFHGSPSSNISTINPSVRGPLGPGTYVSPLETIASRYAGENGSLYQLPQRERNIFNGLGDRYGSGYEGWKADKTALANAATPEFSGPLSSILDRSWMNDGYPMYARISQLYGGDEAAQNLFKKAGFEGISGHVDGPEILLFGPQKTTKDLMVEALLNGNGA